MVNDRNKRGIHTVRGRLGSPRTPMIAFNSVIVTCLARSTACATCCWCCRDREVRPGQSWARGHRAKVGAPALELVTPSFFYLYFAHESSSLGTPPCSTDHSMQGELEQPFTAFFASQARHRLLQLSKATHGVWLSPTPRVLQCAHRI